MDDRAAHSTGPRASLECVDWGDRITGQFGQRICAVVAACNLQYHRFASAQDLQLGDLQCRRWALMINTAPEVLGAQTAKTLGAIGLQQSLLGGIGCFVLMLVAYTLARGGAGDVKLAAAIGALIGFESGMLAIALSYILAGAVIAIWSIWSRGPWKLAMALGRLVGSAILPQWISCPNENDQSLLNTPVPLAGFFAVGTLIVVLEIL